jgi:hypothetical protein
MCLTCSLDCYKLTVARLDMFESSSVETRFGVVIDHLLDVFDANV